MSPSQRRAWRALIAVWAIGVVTFWAWWFRPEHLATVLGMVFNTLLVLWSVVLPAWFFYFVNRMRRLDPALPLPDLRVAMVATHAPSEPWSVVQRTLEGMLAQELPRPYDVWVADEIPTPESLAWCEAHGVLVSSRHEQVDWHRATWPRRTKSKEGNLAYFYGNWGYGQYDVVAQFDADHVPARDYLRQVLPAFNDTEVGYVAAPSMNDGNRSESWAVRGRVYKEGPFHGAYQAGRSGDSAPSCIGSHYVVRTAALREVGGVGPELAEDFSTTMLMNAHGWHGVFALDAKAHGDGPGSVTDYLVQEFQWSRSLTNLGLLVARPWWRGMRRRERFILGFCTTWYGLYTLQMTLAFLLPVVAILVGQPWVEVSLPAFLAHLVPLGLASTAIVVWLARQGWLRPADSKVLSWEIFLFVFTRWPWVLLGVFASVVDTVRGKGFLEKVTPKGVTAAKPLPVRMILPFLVLTAISAGVALLPLDAGAARGYYAFLLVNAMVYLLVVAAVVALHWRENSGRVESALRFLGPHVALTLGATGLVAAAMAVRGGDAYRTLMPPTWQDGLVDALPWGLGALAAVAISAALARLARRRVRLAPSLLAGAAVVVVLVLVLVLGTVPEAVSTARDTAGGLVP